MYDRMKDYLGRRSCRGLAQSMKVSALQILAQSILRVTSCSESKMRMTGTRDPSSEQSREKSFVAGERQKNINGPIELLRYMVSCRPRLTVIGCCEALS
jgi:hypothetical protein